MLLFRVTIFDGQRFRCMPETVIAYNKVTAFSLSGRTDYDPASVLLVLFLIDFGKDRVSILN